MTIGDNSIDKDALQKYVSSIEELEGQKAEIQEDIKAFYQSAKDAHFDVKAIRAIIKKRKQDKTEREEFEATVEAYEAALGDYATTPLAQAAIARVS